MSWHMVLQQGPASHRQISLKSFLQGLARSLFWSPVSPDLLGGGCETSTNLALFIRGRRRGPVQAPHQGQAVVGQKDGLAPDLCAFT